MAIVAQSGSGKSFFLGRLIEEILLQTKARVVVVDPNSFRSIALSVSKEKWKKASYDIVHCSGFLPSEASNFKRRWNCVDGSLFSSVRI
jgi:DNA helicase HerA-like ATPase